MRTLEGTVVSAKMQKTVVVAVPLTRKNSKYQKTYNVIRRFKAHDEKSECVLGDRVRIQEVPPMSREKRWKVIEKFEARSPKHETDPNNKNLNE